MQRDILGDQKDIQKNLKDINSPLTNFSRIAGEEQGGGLSYTKSNKLITALYMVTDIMDKEEPLRHKLRTLGVEILSDITSMTRLNLNRNIQGILSFLDIAFTMNMISEMNKNILINEFTQLKTSLILPQDNPVWLEEFLKEGFPPLLNKEGNEGRSDPYPTSPLLRGRGNSKGRTSIGVQKGSTLMKALSDRTSSLSKSSSVSNINFDTLKKERREDIVKILKDKIEGATIKDIKDIIKDKAISSFTRSSEKTLQRELVSMVKDGVLNKTGEKRWSRYFVK